MEKDWIKKNGCVLFGIFLIPINLICLIGAAIIRNPYEALWVSHYSGLLGAIVLIYKFKKPFLNGLYSFLFIFQLGSVIAHLFDPIPFVSYLDVFYWLNHLPHLVGFYLLAKKDFDITGVHLGFIFILFMMNLTSQILYINSEEGLGINTVFRDYFISNLILALAWYIFLLLLYNKHKKE